MTVWSTRVDGSALKLLCMLLATMLVSVRATCRWSTTDRNGTSGHMECSLRTLQPTAMGSVVLPSGTLRELRLLCSEVYHFESIVSNETWEQQHRLIGLQELHIDGCKLLKIPKSSFQRLTDLRKLLIRTFNADWGSGRVLELESDALEGLRELQALEIVDSNVRALPAALLCALDNLQMINLTRNRLKDFDDIGLTLPPSSRNSSEVVPDNSCHASNIRVLDLSYNEIETLPEETPLRRLRQLQELYLQGNGLTFISSDSLLGLTSLRVLNISNNRLESLPEGLFANTRDLREIHLRGNYLEELPRGLLSRLDQLLVLNLAGNLLERRVDENTFLGLIRLIVLDLSCNRLSRLEAKTFRDLFFLQILDLRNNTIHEIESNAFLPLYNLHTLELSENRLKVLGGQLLNGLFVLNRLTLAANAIVSVDPLAFKNCSDLKELDLSGNELTAVPEALRDLPFLKTLDLGENRIQEFRNGSFRNLHQLTGLRLIGNDIGNLTRGMLWDLQSLQILNLARNKLQRVERDAFERNVRLEAIRLDGNFLSDINGVFAGLASLLLLNLSENHIQWFDYAFVPRSLRWLDIHGNFIEKLGNYYVLRDIRLRTLDASHNRITELNDLSIPDSVELLFVNDNYIGTVRPNTFTGKPNLTRVDLYANMIESLELEALRLSRVPEGKALPEFYIGGNPFVCNCSMDWLPAINNITGLREYPRVMDLDGAICRIAGPRGPAVIPASMTKPEHFLCRYDTHCFALCHCCDFDACDCKMTCPSGCRCHHDRTWNTNLVDCSGLATREIPRRVPMDATELYLDGNDLKELQNHVFIGRKNMRVLYVNGSGIESIQNRTFNGLNNLVSLHLEDNKIQELRGFEFEHLGHLRELYLQNNLIRFLGNLTLLPLRSLEILRLDGNRLVTFPVWQVTLNSRLVELWLGGNPWSCRCKFLRELVSWVADNTHRVVDSRDVWCYIGELGEAYRRPLDVNETTCSDYFSQGGAFDGIILLSDYLPAVAATLTAILLILLVGVLAFVLRGEKRFWQRLRFAAVPAAERRTPTKSNVAAGNNADFVVGNDISVDPHTTNSAAMYKRNVSDAYALESVQHRDKEIHLKDDSSSGYGANSEILGSRQPAELTRLTPNHAYQEPLTRRPISEHIYSSIDSDYSTLERNAWRPPPASAGGGQAYLV